MPHLRDDKMYPKNMEFVRQPIHEKCEGCKYVIDRVCKTYVNPSFWWEQRPMAEGKRFWCPVATHLEKVEPEVHRMLNPIKASKRGRR